MNTSPAPTNGNNGARRRLRRGHRWVGVSVVVFVLFLAVSGIALNHSVSLGLDRRYVSWSWLLDAYGMEKPAPYSGVVILGPMVVVGDGHRVHVLLASGELVESIDLRALLPEPIERVGRAGDRPVLQSGGLLYRGDAEISVFEPWDNGSENTISWSTEVQPDAAGLESLGAAWRGRGLTVERLLLDLHSGRILGRAGPLLMDLVAVFLIVLSLSGLILSKVRNQRK